ncbi:hypothetical protein ACGFJ7_09220 [Actinoplanes sp. NPDC048988]|uniref:hypothetical protein n=1 Tax=Actinoplanes sp. NPDC048988 TaxID=3363901 RepID=UPI0037156771
MRHFRSILYAVVLAPAVWILAGAGFTQDLTTRGRDDFAVESLGGLSLLLLAGAAYAILLSAPISPAGPLLAGLTFLGVSIWALTAPSDYAAQWPANVAKEGFDLSRPGYGLAAMLAIPLLCTALSARRWERYEPPVLPLIGQIGRFRGAAPAPSTPAAILETTVIRPPSDPDPTTVLRLTPKPTSTDSTTAVVVPGSDPTVAGSPPNAPTAATSPLPNNEPTAATTHGEPTAVIASDEPTAATTHSEPTAVIASDEPTAATTHSEPTAVIASDEPTAAPTSSDSTTVIAGDEPTAPATDSDATTVIAGEPTVNTPAAPQLDVEPVATENAPEERTLESAPRPIASPAQSMTAATSPDGAASTAGEPIEASAPKAADASAPAETPDITGSLTTPDPDTTRALTTPDPDTTRSFTAPDPDQTQAIKLTALSPAEDDPASADSATGHPGSAHPATGDTTTGDSAGGDSASGDSASGDSASGDSAGGDSAGGTNGEELANRVDSANGVEAADAGDADGDRTQVIRLSEADGAQVVREDSVESQAQRGGAISIVDAEQPDIADDPTSRIVPAAARAGKSAERAMTVMSMERPPDEIPAQRTPSDGQRP